MTQAAYPEFFDGVPAVGLRAGGSARSRAAARSRATALSPEATALRADLAGVMVPLDSPLRIDGLTVPADTTSLRDLVPTQPLGPQSTVTARSADASMLSPSGLRGKRALDVVVATVVLVLAAPLLLLTFLAVAVESRGGVIFSQERIGKNGKPFRMHKIRSMRPGDDSDHRAYTAGLILGAEVSAQDGVYKLVNNPRITRIGRFIRRFSIDELPQLWNVLRGEMSLVGPRPSLAYEVELFDEQARERLQVQPGMTGLWQVSGRCRLSFSEMIDLDISYMRNWRIWHDLVILAKTPVAALSARGAG